MKSPSDDDLAAWEAQFAGPVDPDRAYAEYGGAWLVVPRLIAALRAARALLAEIHASLLYVGIAPGEDDGVWTCVTDNGEMPYVSLREALSAYGKLIDRDIREGQDFLRAQLAAAEARTHWEPVFWHQDTRCECCEHTELLAMRENDQRARGLSAERIPRRRAPMASEPSAERAG